MVRGRTRAASSKLPSDKLFRMFFRPSSEWVRYAEGKLICASLTLPSLDRVFPPLKARTRRQLTREQHQVF